MYPEEDGLVHIIDVEVLTGIIKLAVLLPATEISHLIM